MSGSSKKSITVEHDIWMPECRYEDNYFTSLCCAYLRSIAFAPEILYYYRSNSSSTIRTRNAQYQIDDRIKVERLLLSDVRKRELFNTYRSAWEYIYTFRYAANTAMLALDLFDKPPYGKLKEIRTDLVRSFPAWRSNAYWQHERSPRSRFSSQLMIRHPRLARFLLKCLSLVRKKEG